MSGGTTKRKGSAAAPHGHTLPTAPPAAEPDLFDRAAELLTENGLANAFSELLDALKTGGSRDEVSAMIAQKHVLSAFREMQRDRAERSDTQELTAELRETRRMLAATQGGASTSFDDAPALPQAGGTDPN